MDIKDKIKSNILNLIFDNLNKNNLTVFLFGSYVTGSATQASDIDLGIIYTDKIPSDKILRLKSLLNEELKILRDIDIIDFQAELDPEFKRIALKDIEIWHKTKESYEILKNMRMHYKL